MSYLIVPKFRQVELPIAAMDDFDSSKTQGTYSADFNGDKVPDELRVTKEGNRVDFLLELGEFVRPDRGRQLVNPLFRKLEGQIVRRARSYIWEAEGDIPMHITYCKIEDVNSDGDLDIRFVASTDTGKGRLIYAFDLLNQTIPDPLPANGGERKYDTTDSPAPRHGSNGFQQSWFEQGALLAYFGFTL